MGVGENIRIFRLLNGMTQEELAEKMGYKSKTSINKIEKEVNNIPVDKLQAIADILHTTPDALLGKPVEPEYVIGPHIRGMLKGKGIQADSSQPESSSYTELMDIANDMNENGLKRLLAYAQDIYEKYRKEK